MTAINRPLTDDERSLLLALAVAVVAEQTGRDRETAADALDGMNVVLRGDAINVYVEAGGRVLVHATREWLAFHANHPGQPMRGEPLLPDE